MRLRRPKAIHQLAAEARIPEHRVVHGLVSTTDTLDPLTESPQSSLPLSGMERRTYLGEVAGRGIRNPGTVTLPSDLR